MRFAVAVGGHVTDQAFAFEALDFSLQGLHFAGGKKNGHGGVSVIFEVRYLFFAERHVQLLRVDEDKIKIRQEKVESD